MKRVGFIGLGLMGGPMAANIARGGFPLTVFNRDAAKAEPLRALGARVAARPAEVAAESEVVITMLSDVNALRQMANGPQGFLATAAPSKVWIDMSTVAPAHSREMAAAANAAGWHMLDAPVSGSTGPAKEGKLGIMVGGEREIFEAQRDVLSAMGSHLYYLGPQGSGTLAKLCLNLLVAAQMASLAEAMVLAAKGGLDLAPMGQVIRESGVVSALIDRKIGNILEGNYAAAFPLKHMHKDVGLMIDQGHLSGTALPLTGSVHQLFTAARARGLGEEDLAAVFKLLAELSGLVTH
ncbi:MAG: NAD(P)-dependent oxidoreductase [Chloroflexi bacterium]|nr:NAD(P)-dependent oxidoreductase [Chloroflexota bacterium]